MILILLLAMCCITEAQALKEGDIIIIKYVGHKTNPGDNKVMLAIDPPTGFFKMVPEDSSGANSSALWQVKSGGEKGVFRFMNLNFGDVYGVNSPATGN